MPIDFSSIPPNIQVSLVQKLDAKDFVSLLQTSKEADDAAKGLKTGISLPCEFGEHISVNYDHEDIAVTRGCWDDLTGTYTHRTVKLSQMSEFKFKGFAFKIKRELNDGFCRSLIQYFHRTTSVYLDIVTCSPELFQILLEVMGATSIMTSTYQLISREYVRYIPSHIDTIYISSELTDCDLLKMRALFISLANTKISSRGINALLREWYKGKRNLYMLSIATDEEINKEEILEGMEYTETEIRHKYEINNGYTCITIKIFF